VLNICDKACQIDKNASNLEGPQQESQGRFFLSAHKKTDGHNFYNKAIIISKFVVLSMQLKRKEKI